MAATKERYPYLSIEVDAFTSDELVEAMSTEEVGAYFLLICKAWKSEPPCTIPDDDKTLARWARMSVRRWLACKEKVLAPWKIDAPGRLFQKRLRESFAHVTAQVEKKKAAGAKGGKAKANRKTLEKPQETPSTATALLEQCYSTGRASLEQCSSTGGSTMGSKTVADPYQIQSQIQIEGSPIGDPPPQTPPQDLNSAVAGIEIDGELVTYDQDHLRWIPEFIRRWNKLPGVRKHDGGSLSMVNVRALRERLSEPDWFWQRAFAKFPLHLPGGVWQITLGTFLEPATVSKILDGKYEQSTRETGLFGSGQRDDPTKVRTGDTATVIAAARAKAVAERVRVGDMVPGQPGSGQRHS